MSCLACEAGSRWWGEDFGELSRIAPERPKRFCNVPDAWWL